MVFFYYILVRLAEGRCVKLIVFDAHPSQGVGRAGIHLALKLGADTVMCLEWLDVIIEEIHDKEFVKSARWV